MREGLESAIAGYASTPMWSVHERKPDRLLLEHLFDTTAEAAIGSAHPHPALRVGEMGEGEEEGGFGGALNLELMKNVTVDLPVEADLNLWRDKLGFILRDTIEFLQV